MQILTKITVVDAMATASFIFQKKLIKPSDKYFNCKHRPANALCYRAGNKGTWHPNAPHTMVHASIYVRASSSSVFKRGR